MIDFRKSGRGQRLASLTGLAFGDCGKGLFTDFLCREWDAKAVVRFNGGAQAGHNVVLDDGSHHTFSQFCAGMLQPDVIGVLASPVIVHPTALLVERDALQVLVSDDPLARLLIDERCLVNTPFHQAAGRLRELSRGAAAHGTCGVGVGETVRHSIESPSEVLRYGDLAHAELALGKLEVIRGSLLREVQESFESSESCESTEAWRQEMQLLADDRVSARWLDLVASLIRICPPRTTADIGVRLSRCAAVVFEGAQGILLDEWKGFHPHTTWSSVAPNAASAVAHELGLIAASGSAREMSHFGILRSYLTRHGAGPLPTHDPALDALAEPHNTGDGWQGAFRRGHPDAVLLRYAVDASGPLDGIFLSHLDVFEKPAVRLRWNVGYEDSSGLKERDKFDRLMTSEVRDLEYQQGLTELLSRVSPVYSGDAVSSSEDLIQRIEAVARCPVVYGSFGPSASKVRAI